VRNIFLHRALESFTVDASSRLLADAAGGADMPFELYEERGRGQVPLYCYKPLTGEFIQSRMGALATLPSYGDALRGLADSEALDTYLSEHGVKAPADVRGRCQETLLVFLDCVFSDRSGFGFEPAHFEAAYADLERALYQGHCTATVIAPLLGVALDSGTVEIKLEDGLWLIRGDALPDAPAEAVWGEGEEPNVLALLAIDQERPQRPPVSIARARFRRILSALRLFEHGGYAVGPVGWARSEAGRWRPVSVGFSGRVGGVRSLTLVPGAQGDELRAFYRLVARRAPAPELAWALARFEMGCERLAPLEALTDYLLALRALLEPEGPASGRLGQRVAAICARPEDRVALSERAAQAIALERAAITGLAGAQDDPRRPDALVDELAEHLRAILRDALCGYLAPDLCAVADELLAESAAARTAQPTNL
jgi:hypothetical protein